MEPRLTYREISEKAQVSIMTVSNALRGTRNVSDRTKKRVELAIRELGGSLPQDTHKPKQQPVVSHRPFRRFRLITRGQSKAVRNVRVYHSLFESLITEAAASDYEISCHYYDGLETPKMERFGQQTDALYLMGEWSDLEERPPVPAITLMSTTAWFAQDQVSYHRERVGILAARFLLSRNCRSVAYIGGEKKQRWIPFIETIKNHSTAAHQTYPMDQIYTYNDDVMRINYQLVMDTVRKMLKSSVPLDGVFAHDDMVAMAVKDALHSLGAGNRKIAIIGCNNDPGAIDILGGNAATIDLGISEMARVAVARAIEWIKHPRLQGQTIMVEPKLILPQGQATEDPYPQVI